ncbi:UDP-N-acetylglucosamine 2-epimerase (non-hydrolyzing) [Leptospira sp. 2 VSF19]|uniref:UDP-N-acetylglucosamine 2-epimerase (Non-hydrolyzing) n=1 Tax=Leptospira soteropolitanensis TaxID=2950025 RepID=A0AAW5VDA0_9LEPT|nr:UDP-N-acetylglucosamine 2-epimerase (non-hydrolyzing) [Leptospira soteropolitanensis]MCW7493180.1 UDP-N-acetylglucosamine 2-epimerase (non-hydrolyzing) [Leptospira soteropolitanensis]MCW7500751.1 UDP-N-acetylglucosamine 2-epimerase (non-hydrolyzing) [Leptospira soteropolitanensis]MCW7523030.1 UDP-N-acetylglucosamine 2-epimerase (non-hydrolyzing) [Leptospira soteropolitanensis]MCW7526863.1 UDP-N-acetylglucosamine 2-epimerase (non-hydrolyzing) [Leptospira soteropolitanensis]MCW7530748.1 UDP-N
MKKLKVFTVIGTRPEIIRLSRVMIALDEVCDHKIIHTGQNYDFELNEIFFQDLGIRKPDYFLDAAGGTGAETIGKIIIRFDELLSKETPDALLVLGDTNSCLSVIPAKRRKIPIFHMEAGNRCFDLRVPEEINRRIVDHTSDINLTYSSIAREYLLREGLPPDQVIKTGSPMYEVLNHYKNEIHSSKILEQLNLKSNEYFLVSAHREENIDSEPNFRSLVDTLNTIAESYSLPVIVSTHPRTQKKIDHFGIQFHKNILLLKPLGFMDYNKLQIESKVVLSDSGTITEESSILKFSALNIREAHERPEGMEEAAVMMVGLNKERILQALSLLEMQGKDFLNQSRLVEDYSMPNVSAKVIRIILSYTDYVNRIVWKRY